MINISAHGGMYGGVHLKGRRLISFFIQLDEPNDKKKNDVWIKTSESLGEVAINDGTPLNPTDRLVWQSVDRLDYSINLKELELYVKNGKNKVEVAINDDSVLSNIPSNKIALFENMYMKGYGAVRDVFYYDQPSQNWERLEGVQWDGIQWNQISFSYFRVYETGIDYVGLEFNGEGTGEGSKESDHLLMHAYAQGSTGSTSVSRAGYNSVLIDVTKYSRLRIKFTGTIRRTFSVGSQGSVRFGLSMNTNNQTFDVERLFTTTTANTDETKNLSDDFIIDISDLSGEFYIRSEAIATVRGEATVKVKSIRLE